MTQYATNEKLVLTRGTTWKPRITARHPSTRVPLDMSGYDVEFAMKAQADETSEYLISPTAGTSDSSGHLDATIEKSVTADIEPTAEGEFYIGEFRYYTDSIDRKIQFQIEVQGRVNVT